ncbi:probable aquaporin SIP2-1 [Mercurialis annua]|uniref:probable aquaporin SIP2-1 n=1 Tax=Mercurialis annua TaxID=3986 RepID=UPI002160FC74|nr:probable aquaporin SIP2-1 [Mercurialis annua]
MGGGLIISDFVISFMWVWSGAVIKMFVNGVLGMGHEPSGEVVKYILSVINMFVFAWLGKMGAYNPLTVLSSAISADSNRFLLTLGARIPAQIIGSITGVRLILQTFPEIGFGPRLNVDIHRGALTEGLLTFAIVTISLGLSRKIPGSFFMKTWITSVSKLALHILGSDLTGGCMNPASVMGWAYARGDHITKEHILVYWLAPIEATLLAVWIFKLVVGPLTQENKEMPKRKSD